MSYIFNVHYKSDPADLIWQYSGMLHTCLHDAVNEMISAQKQPHIDKAYVVGSGSRIGEGDLLIRSIGDVIIATENLVTFCEKIAHVPIVTNYGSVVFASACDMIEQHEVKREEIIHELENVIRMIKEV